MKIGELFATLKLKPDPKGFKAGTNLINKIKVALVAFVSVQTVRFFARLINDVAQAADGFAKMAKRTGIAVETLQGLEFAAEISGTSLASLRNGLKRLARNASDAGRGLKTAKDAFKDAGVEINGADGKLRPLNDLLLDAADSLSKMEDGTKKSALAQELFGRAGDELIPLLNEGKEGVQALIGEYIELGAVLDKDTVKAFEKFNDTQRRVSALTTGFKNLLVTTLLPTLQSIADGAISWFKANKQLIRQKMISFAKALIRVLKVLIKIGIVLGAAFLFVANNMGLVTIAVMSLVLAMKILKLGSIKAALASAAAWGLALLPILLLAAGIAIVLLVLEDLWQLFTGGKSFLKDLAIEAANMVSEWVNEWLETFEEFWEFMSKEVDEFIDNLLGGIVKAAKAVKAFFLGEDNEGTNTIELASGFTGTLDEIKELAKTGEIGAGAFTAQSPKLQQEARQFLQVEQQRQVNSITNQITINAETGASAEDIAEEIRRVQDTLNRETAAALGS